MSGNCGRSDGGAARATARALKFGAWTVRWSIKSGCALIGRGFGSCWACASEAEGEAGGEAGGEAEGEAEGDGEAEAAGDSNDSEKESSSSSESARYGR